jgi:glycosyltransferase involved in cell wall biosynthesis
MNPSRVWVASELYYPEQQATGVFMTKIAEGLAARGMDVKALAAQPHTGRVASREVVNGVEVFRCWSTRFSKNNLPGRMLNVLTGNITMLFAALWRIQRNEIVLVVTNPPTLPFVIMLACLIKGAKCIVRVDDVYPDVLHACDVYSNESAVYKVFDWLMKWLLRKADAMVVLGRDMQALVASKTDGSKEIRVITNWADVDTIGPDPEAGKAFLAEYGLTDKLVLQWAGNMGYPHEVETLLDAMEKLADEDDVHFLYIGAGAKRPWLEKQVAQKGLKNVTFVGMLPREQQQAFLNGCDIGLSSLVAGMTGISVPSRSYNILCAGKPILAVGEPEGEISQLLRDKDVGWVIAPGESDKIVAVVKELLADRSVLVGMSKRARELAEAEYSSAYIIGCYADMITEYAAGN